MKMNNVQHTVNRACLPDQDQDGNDRHNGHEQCIQPHRLLPECFAPVVRLAPTIPVYRCRGAGGASGAHRWSFARHPKAQTLTHPPPPPLRIQNTPSPTPTATEPQEHQESQHSTSTHCTFTAVSSGEKDECVSQAHI